MSPKSKSYPTKPISSTIRSNGYFCIGPGTASGVFQGKVSLGDGGGYGIKQSIAEAFAIANASHIAITGRTESKLKETTVELGKRYPDTNFSYIAADITDTVGVKAIFEAFGTRDILILKIVDLREWWEGFEINVLGTALVIQTYLRTKAPETDGIVITLNSIAAHWGSIPNLSAYAASKAASLRMIEMFQAESSEVRFMSIHPGAVERDMGTKSGLKGIPHTDPVLTANFILWSTSPEAEFLKGRFAWVNWDV